MSTATPSPAAPPEVNLVSCSPLLRLAWVFAGGILYYIAAKLGLTLFTLKPGIACLWLPSGIGLIMYLRLGWRALPVVLVASFTANYPALAHEDHRLQIICAGLSSIADSLAPLLAARLIHTYVPNGLQRVQDLSRFTLYACMLPTLVSSVLISVSLILGNYISLNQAPGFFLTLLVGDSLGILLVYSLYTSWISRSQEDPIPISKAAVLSVMAIIVLRLLAYEAEPSLIFFIVPVLLYLVFTASALFVSLTMMFTTGLIIGASTKNLGPFNIADQESGARMIVVFLFSTALVVTGMQLQRKELIAENAGRREWERKAGYDALTGLANRQLLMPMLRHQIERAQRSPENSFCLGMIDIDHFKAVNDTHGHPVGDKVLVSIARTMKQTLRAVDVPARYGGEEFAILFPDTSLQHAADAMERVRAAIERKPIPGGGQLISITVSGGLAQLEDHMTSAEDLIQSADDRLYAAKRNGRNQIIQEAPADHAVTT